MLAIPMRGGVDEAIQDMKLDLNLPGEQGKEGGDEEGDDDEWDLEDASSPTGAFTLVWTALLRGAASDSKVNDEELSRYIKDAHDYSAIR